MNVIDRASNLIEIEEKVIRRVRTPAGVRWFGQPIGSIIVRDPPRIRRRKRVAKRIADLSPDLMIAESLVMASEEDITKRQKALEKTRKDISRTRNRGEYSDWEDVVKPANSFGTVPSMKSVSEMDGIEINIEYFEPDKSQYPNSNPPAPWYEIRGRDKKTGRKARTQIIDAGDDPDYDEGRAFELADEAYNYLYDNRPEEFSVDNPLFWDNWEGMRNRDWAFDDDEEDLPDWSDDEDDQVEILNAEMDRLGIDVFGQNERYPSTSATAAIVSVMGLMEERHPGFSRIQSRFTIDLDSEHSVGGIAFNRPISQQTKRFLRNGMADYARGFEPIRAGAEMDHFDADGNYGQTLIGLNPNYFAHDIDPTLLEGRWEAALTNNPTWFSYNAQAIKDMTGMTWTEIGHLTTVTHEIGHTFGFVLFRNIWDDQTLGEESMQRYNNMKRLQEIFERHGISTRDGMDRWSAHNQMNKLPVDNRALARNLSEYGAYNVHEVFAESFAAYMLNPTPSQLAVDIGQLLEEAMEEYLKYKERTGWKGFGE